MSNNVSRRTFIQGSATAGVVVSQTLMGGEKLTETFDKMLDTLVDLGDKILNLTAVATAVGPTGPISSGPPNVAAIEQWKGTVEAVRAEICDCLLKPK